MANEKSVIEGRAIQSGQPRTDPARDAAGGEKSAGDFKFELSSSRRSSAGSSGSVTVMAAT